MTFDELWEQVAELKVLPNMAVDLIPDVLTEKTKKKLTRLSPHSAVEVIIAAVDEVDQGSVQSLDTLIKRRL